MRTSFLPTRRLQPSPERFANGDSLMFRAPLARRLFGPIAAAALLVSASGAHAQTATASVDARFQPWLGCWRPLDTGLGLE